MPTILIADDQEANRMVLARLFTREGYHVIEAADGAEALEKTIGERPDIALVDLLMPVLGGFDFTFNLRQVEGEVARTPVVFLSGAYMPSEAFPLAWTCGVTHVLERPLPFEAIRVAVSEALAAGPSRVATVSRLDFTLELLKVMTSKLSHLVRTVIPSIGGIDRGEGQEKIAPAPGPDEGVSRTGGGSPGPGGLARVG